MFLSRMHVFIFARLIPGPKERWPPENGWVRNQTHVRYIVWCIFANKWYLLRVSTTIFRVWQHFAPAMPYYLLPSIRGCELLRQHDAERDAYCAINAKVPAFSWRGYPFNSVPERRHTAAKGRPPHTNTQSKRSFQRQVNGPIPSSKVQACVPVSVCCVGAIVWNRYGQHAK